MDACREYGQPPSWWGTLTPEDRTVILADYRRRHQSAKRGPSVRPAGRG